MINRTSKTSQLREELVIAAINYVTHVVKVNGPNGHFTEPGGKLSEAVEAFAKAMRENILR